MKDLNPMHDLGGHDHTPSDLYECEHCHRLCAEQEIDDEASEGLAYVCRECADEARVAEREEEARERLVAAAPELLAALKVTCDLALELVERAETIDSLLGIRTGSEHEVELGQFTQITRMRHQISRATTLIARAEGRAL